MIDFYGSAMSSAGRTHVMLEECGVPYAYHRIDMRDPTARAAYLKVNPGGKIPFLIDGELRIPESIAINFYLAESYAPQLWCSDVAERAHLYAWSLWGISTLQHEALRVLHHTMIVTAEHRSTFEVEQGQHATQRYFDHLERELPTSGYLVGDRYTVADLNVASVVNLCVALGATPAPRVASWLASTKARPAWQKAAAAG